MNPFLRPEIDTHICWMEEQGAHTQVSQRRWLLEVPKDNNVTVLINALPGNNSINKVQHATTEESVFSVDPTDAPIDWLGRDHVICVYFRSTFVPRLYNESREL
jgi:hypothetical protein